MKHAYLIMAHNNFYNLRLLLKLLDDERNEIYIHINKKVKNWNDDEWKCITKKSKIHFVKRVKVRWCCYSQMDAVKNLLIESTRTYHDYYHMLSGADLPIKTNDEIDQFFTENKGKEFVGFAPEFDSEKICQKNYFIKYFKSNKKLFAKIMKNLSKLLIQLQKMIGVDLSKKYNGQIKKGCDWFSISHEAAIYLLQQEPYFKSLFYKSFCPTEFFLHTVLYNSRFRKNIYSLDDENKGSQRYIDWNRGEPYVFKLEDKKLLLESPYMFARKFSQEEDYKIILYIYRTLKYNRSSH